MTSRIRLRMESGPSQALLVGAGVGAFDQLSKALAGTASCRSTICPLRNDALFLGLGGGSGVHRVVVSVVGLAMFVAWVAVLHHRGSVPAVAVSLVTAGIVTNTLDRVIFGYVRDFLQTPFGAVINVADVAVIGGLLACAVAASRSLLHIRSNSERG